MNLTEIIFLAIALGIDCLVVSFSQGLILTHNRLKNSLILALTMGLFQGSMPVLSYFGTDLASKFIMPYSKWLVFIIFGILGLKFIYEAFQEREENVCCICLKCLIGMGIATSIDALAAGISINLSSITILLPAILIGLVSFFMSITGFSLGIFFKRLPSKYLMIFGGLILLFLAFKACLN